MTIVARKKAGETDDRLIATFKKKVLFEKLVEEVKDRTFYTKPSRARYMRRREIERRRNWIRSFHKS